MASVSKTAKGFSVTAYQGDAKTLLAFNLPKADSKRLAGFTIQCGAPGQKPYYLLNELQFERPADHAQDPTVPANSSINAPIHKFRWLHVPGASHQGLKPVFGAYQYVVTPRYFNANDSLLPLDPGRSVAVSINVAPFRKNGLALGFTRGFVQSQAFVRHFGKDALIRPAGKAFLYDTSAQSGANARGEKFTYAQEYEWLGFTARERIFEILDAVAADGTLWLDVFAYDLNEPDVARALVSLAKQGRVRVILDNAGLHHDKAGSTPEDQFEKLFRQAAKKPADLLRGKFARYSHDKVLIVSRIRPGDKRLPIKVLTGSTNFSVTGLYVNSNHVLVFEDAVVAAKYAEVFETAWTQQAKAAAFRASPLAKAAFGFKSTNVPQTQVTFSPHEQAYAGKLLSDLVDRVKKEGKQGKKSGSVLFAVMDLGKAATGPVFPALRSLHADQKIISYGISDNPEGISLYEPKRRTGVLVTGKPANTVLPPPFDQVPSVSGHQVHHKFVVCGFNRSDAVVYCGSSNLALGGETENGDNLLALSDEDVVTAFAIEAVALVDHFQFLDRTARGPKAKKGSKKPAASKQQAAVSAGWFLSTTDKWAAPYFDPQDLHCADRELFGG